VPFHGALEIQASPLQITGQLRRPHAHPVAALIHQRPRQILRLHLNADLEMACVISGPECDAISPRANFGANPCNPILVKPTVPTNFTLWLVDIGSDASRPFAFNKAKSLAASTFSALAQIKPAPVISRTCGALRLDA
jgi:hypothetical protein